MRGVFSDSKESDAETRSECDCNEHRDDECFIINNQESFQHIIEFCQSENINKIIDFMYFILPKFSKRGKQMKLVNDIWLNKLIECGFISINDDKV